MKKCKRVLLLTGLTAFAITWNTGSITDGIQLIHAAEEDNITSGETSPQDLFSDQEEGSGKETLPLPEESGTAETFSPDNTVLNLPWDESVFTVPWDSINSLEEEKQVLLAPFGERYVSCFIPKEKSGYALSFSKNVAKEDVRVYKYDTDAGQVKDKLNAEEILQAPDGAVLTQMEDGLEYIITLDHANTYPDLQLTVSKASPEQMAAEESAAEETTEPETVAETETEPEAKTVHLESASLLFDDGLEQVPVAFLPYLDGQAVVKIRLQYSDGSEQLLTQAADIRQDSLGNSFQLTYEDLQGEDGSVSRTYSLKVVSSQGETQAVSVEPETVVFQKEAPDGIENIPAQEKSSVRYYGKKNWILVQSVPKVTGKYAMESFGRGVKELYYCAQGETEAVKADTAFELKKGVTYTFLLKLEE